MFRQPCAHHQEKLLYLCDTGICHPVWVASGLLVGVKLQPADQTTYTKQNCASSWIYLQDSTGIHGQQNLKFRGSIFRKTVIHTGMLYYVLHASV